MNKNALPSFANDPWSAVVIAGPLTAQHRRFVPYGLSNC